MEARRAETAEAIVSKSIARLAKHIARETAAIEAAIAEHLTAHAELRADCERLCAIRAFERVCEHWQQRFAAVRSLSRRMTRFLSISSSRRPLPRKSPCSMRTAISANAPRAAAAKNLSVSFPKFPTLNPKRMTDFPHETPNMQKRRFREAARPAGVETLGAKLAQRREQGSIRA
jgi:hypothetical protein